MNAAQSIQKKFGAVVRYNHQFQVSSFSVNPGTELSMGQIAINESLMNALTKLAYAGKSKTTVTKPIATSITSILRTNHGYKHVICDILNRYSSKILV